MIVRGGGEARLRTWLVLNVSCNILDWKYIFFSMSFRVSFPQIVAQFSLSSFELGWPNTNNHLLAQCTFEDWLGKPTQSEHRAMMKVFLCYQPVPSPSWAVRQNILLDNSRTTWERLPCPFLFGALLHNWQTPKIIATMLHWIKVCHPCQEPWLHQTHRTLVVRWD